MSLSRKGFVDFVLLGALAVISVVAGVLYAKYEVLRQTANNPSGIGAQVYQTQLSDTINTLRLEVNSSTANLNTELETVSGTVKGLGNLSTINSPLPVANGGSGTTTAPTDSQLWSASGTTPTWKNLVAGSGITEATTSNSITLSTPGFNSGANIAFTGNNTYAGTTALNGAVTVSSSTLFNVFPTVATTSPTSSLQVAPKGYVDSHGPQFLLATTTSSTFSDGGSSTYAFNLSIPSRVLFTVSGYLTVPNNAFNSCFWGVYTNNATSVDPITGYGDGSSGQTAGDREQISFSYLTPTALSAGTNTLAVISNQSVNGQCTSTVFYAGIENMGPN